MKQKAARVDIVSGVRATSTALSRMESAIKLAESLRNDPDMERRLARQFCRPCHYMPGLGGSAITERPCGLCATNVVYGSTNTGVLCQACAKVHDLCAKCGGDIELRTRRRKFPSTPVLTQEQDS